MLCMLRPRKPSAAWRGGNSFQRAKITFSPNMAASTTKTFPALAQQAHDGIGARTARVGVIGLGYVGLPLVLLFSEQKFRVTGFDVDASKVTSLNAGESYIYHIPATEIQSAARAGFSATADYAHLAEMDAVVICVPTPLNDHREPDLSYITATAEAMAPHVRAGQLIILESTTFPGTTQDILAPILEQGSAGLRAARSGAEPSAKDFYVAFSPERENPGDNSIARRDIPKVVGGMDAVATELAAALYHTIFDRIVPVSG